MQETFTSRYRRETTGSVECVVESTFRHTSFVVLVLSGVRGHCYFCVMLVFERSPLQRIVNKIAKSETFC